MAHPQAADEGRRGRAGRRQALYPLLLCPGHHSLVLRALSPVLEVLRGPWRDQLLGYFGWREASFDESEKLPDTENVDNDGIVNKTREMV